jgi:hypothetical protein
MPNGSQKMHMLWQIIGSVDPNIVLNLRPFNTAAKKDL